MELNSAQLKNREYNLSQTEVGHPLKTLKGSVIKRSNFGVGKLIGGQIYFHRNHADRCLFDEGIELMRATESDVPFEFNCMRFDLKTGQLAFVECPDFDTSREPVVGRMYVVDSSDEPGKVTKFFNQIYHHKWLWVDNSYSGFDVAESWEWSKTWLSVLTEPADGTNTSRWIGQLNRFGLK